MIQPLQKNNAKAWPEPQFWWLQIGGWLVYPFFIHFAYTPADAHIATAVNMWPLYYAWEAFLGFLLTLGLREVQKRLWHKPIWLAMTVTVVAVALAAEAWTVGKLVVYYEYFPHIRENDFWVTVWEWYPNSLTVLAAWSAIYHGFKYRNTLMDREKSLLTAQTAAKDAQLKMLRYQLNPHFLFNTLANICALISDGKADRAKNMTIEISEFLRYSLDKDPLETNDLRDEVRVLKLYLNIEKIRYGGRMNYEFRVADDTLSFQIPSMLLQPLVENSIKHAIASSVSEGNITIASYIKDDLLVLSVKDDGPGRKPSGKRKKHVGIGMNNTKERLTSFYGNQHLLEVLDVTPHGLEVRISIPLMYARGSHND